MQSICVEVEFHCHTDCANLHSHPFQQIYLRMATASGCVRFKGAKHSISGK